MFLPTPYPIAFTISFVTNITGMNSIIPVMTAEDTLVTTMDTNDGINNLQQQQHHQQRQQQWQQDNQALKNETQYPIHGTLYYDWNLRSQRIDHDAGSYECTHFYQTTHPCTLLFVPDHGMYRFIHDNNNTNISNKTIIDDCCLDIPDLTTPPPNWASMYAKPTFDGIVYDDYSQLLSYQWTFDQNITSSSSNDNYIDNISTFRKQQQNIMNSTLSSFHQTQHLNQQENRRRRRIRLRRSRSIDGKNDDSNQRRNIGSNSMFHTHREVAIILSSDDDSKTKNHNNNTTIYALRIGTPVLFSFPSKMNGIQDYHYDPYSIQYDQPPNPSLFDLPQECIMKQCNV